MKLKSLFILFCGGVACAVSLAGIGYFQIQRWAEAPQILSEPRIVDFPKGTPLSELSKRLAEEQILGEPLLFELWVKGFSNYAKFQAGTYKFEGATSPRDIAKVISLGNVHEEVAVEFTIPEGFTVRQVAQRMHEKGIGELADVLRLTDDPNFLASLSLPATYIEGYLYPATYRFPNFPTPQMVFEEMVRTFWKKVPPNYEQAVATRGLTFHEAIVFASLIELETPHADEKPKVAEVIWRRLEEGIPLGIDAAIIYGIADYAGDIKREHLVDRSNPYNLRLHAGLPPTPITSPTTSSLEAVLVPSREGYMYYVVDSDTDRRHHFSKTLEEHERYVRKLVQSGK